MCSLSSHKGPVVTMLEVLGQAHIRKSGDRNLLWLRHVPLLFRGIWAWLVCGSALGHALSMSEVLFVKGRGLSKWK